MPKTKVVVLRTTPNLILEDYKKLLNYADYQQYISKNHNFISTS